MRAIISRLDGIIAVRVGGTESLRNESDLWNTAFASHQSFSTAKVPDSKPRGSRKIRAPFLPPLWGAPAQAGPEG